MIEVPGWLLSLIKQTRSVTPAVLAIACGIILFGSDALIETIDLKEFKEANKPYIGGLFILFLSIVFVQAATKVFGFFKSIFTKWQESKARKTNLVKLTPDEKAYLVPYVLDQKTTQYFLMEDGIKGSLELKGILYRASSMGNMEKGWAYNIQPWAKEYLENNPDLLEGFTQNMQRHSRL